MEKTIKYIYSNHMTTALTVEGEEEPINKSALRKLMEIVLRIESASISYLDILDFLGQAEDRFIMISAIFDSFIPVWPNRDQHTKILMARLGAAIIPELAQD